MKQIVQKDPTGCGLACVAMLTDKTYNKIKTQAKDELRNYPLKRNNYRTEAIQLRKLCAKHGIKLGKQSNFKSFNSLPSLALLATKYKEKVSGDEWHWVLYEQNKNRAFVYDPNPVLKSVKRKDFQRVGKNCKWYFSVLNT